MPARTRRLVSLMLFLIGISSSVPITAQNFQLVGHVGGTVQTGVVSGNFAYISEGAFLTVLDLSTSPPTARGRIGLPDYPEHMVARGSDIYIACGYLGGLRVVRCANPDQPFVAFQKDTIGSGSGVATAPGRSYVADGFYGLLIISMTNGQVLGSYNTAGDALGVAVNGRYAYVADNSAFVVVDMQNETTPSLAASIPTPGSAVGIALTGNYAYLADTNQLTVVEVTTPTQPVIRTSIPLVGQANDLVTSGNQLVVALGSAGYQLFDITNRANPVAYAPAFDTPGTCSHIAFGPNRRLYVMDSGNGLEVFDIANPAAPVEIVHTLTPGDVYGVDYAQGLAWLAAGVYGIAGYDFTNPAVPQRVGGYNTPGRAFDIEVTDGLALVADETAGMRVLNVTNPAAINEIGFYQTSQRCNSLRRFGDSVYLAVNTDGARRVNFTNPALPTFAAGIDPELNQGNAIVVQSGTAFFAGGTGGLYLLDTTVNNQLTTRSQVNTPGNAYGVALAGNTCFVADGNTGVLSFDISNLNNPVQLGVFDTFDAALWVSQSNGVLFVAGDRDGVFALNASKPATMNQLGYFNTPGRTQKVRAYGDTVYVADGGGGLYLLRYTGPKAAAGTWEAYD